MAQLFIQTNLGLTRPQIEWLDRVAGQLGIGRAELARRIIDAARINHKENGAVPMASPDDYEDPPASPVYRVDR